MANSQNINFNDKLNPFQSFIKMADKNNNQDNRKAMEKLAGKVMCDRQLLWKLTDKVYKLMIEDLQQQKERIKN